MLDLARLRALHAVSVHGSVARRRRRPRLHPVRRVAADRQAGAGDPDHAAGAAGARASRSPRRRAIWPPPHRSCSPSWSGPRPTLEERRGQPTGRLTIGAFASAARGLLPGVLAELAARHPGARRPADRGRPASVRRPGRPAASIDLAVAHDWDIAPLPAPEGVEQAVIGDDLCDLLVPEGHPLAGRDVRAARGAGGAAVDLPAAGHGLPRLAGPDAARGRAASPTSRHQAEENHTQLALVAAGLGIALIPRLGRGPLPPGWWRCRWIRCRCGGCTRCGGRGRRAARRSRRRCGRCGPLAGGDGALEPALTAPAVRFGRSRRREPGPSALAHPRAGRRSLRSAVSALAAGCDR